MFIITNLDNAYPRISWMIKYLPEYGWEPIILSLPCKKFSDNFKNEIPIIEVDYQKSFNWLKRFSGFSQDQSVRRNIENQYGTNSIISGITRFLLKLVKEFFFYPDQHKGFRKVGIQEGSRFLEENHIDAIISSSSPVTSNIIAKELKKKFYIPWLADLRDLWSQNINYPYSSIRKKIDRNLEKKTLLTADAITSFSQPWADKLKTLHKNDKIYSITNGFYPEEKIIKKELTKKLTITYTGQIYINRQDPLKLLTAIKELISEGKINENDIEVRYYGDIEALVTEEIKKKGLSNVAKQYGIITRQKALEKQRESHIVLLLNWQDQQEKGVFPHKIFEYLASNRPILATGGFGNDVIEQLLIDTKAGYYATEIKDIKRILLKVYSDYKINGKIKYNPKKENIDKYCYREIAKVFASILDDISNKK